MPACLQELVDRVRSGGGQPGGSAGGSPTGGDFENLAWFGARLGRRPGVDELRDVSSLLGVACWHPALAGSCSTDDPPATWMPAVVGTVQRGAPQRSRDPDILHAPRSRRDSRRKR